MPTFVFVLMTMTASNYWVPTIEFSTADKCEKAAASFVVEADRHVKFTIVRQPWCWKVEK